MINNYGQQIEAGDFVVSARMNGTVGFYLVTKIGTKETTASLSYFSEDIVERERIDGRWLRVTPPRVEVREHKTRSNYPHCMWRAHLEDYPSLSPAIYRAFMEKQMEILNDRAP